MTFNFSSLVISDFYTCKPQFSLSPSEFLCIFSHSICLKLNFLLSVFLLNSLKSLDASLLMPSNVIIKLTHSACNLGIVLNSTLSMSDHISSVSKFCFISIRGLWKLLTVLRLNYRHIIHSKLDFSNSLFLNLPQLILEVKTIKLWSLAASQTPKFS